MHRGSGLAVCFVAGLGLLAQCLAAAQAGRKPAPRSPELDKAVAELKREYAAHVKDPAGRPLRTQCDYFKGKTFDIPVEALLPVLEKPLAGTGATAGDQRAGAYVKWQLLSALPPTLDDDAARRLVAVYERAPLPPMRYACAAGEQRQLDQLLTGARPQDDLPLTAKLEEAVARGTAAHAPVIAYRDELYRRLPVGKAKFLAALADINQRLGVAAPTDVLGEELAADLPKWSGVAATDRADVREVAESLGKLRFVESPPYYARAAVRRGKLTWVTDTGTLLTKRRSATLHKLLLESAGFPAAPPALAGAGGRQPRPAAATAAPAKGGKN